MAFCFAIINSRFDFCAARIAGITPCTPRNWPVSASSATNSNCFKRLASSCSDAAKIPMAIGKSNRPPSFGKSAGARFTVIRLAGYLNCAFINALRTRSCASFTVFSGKPTSVNPGFPLLKCTSMVTSGACTPIEARL